ncbi:hypothetical protein L484_010721 [Morus notabilis]|uniref:DUF1677 domain-containing protein n=1 Tax=Morus notabilis TaxID=981085 RepID=W9RTN3_9ROSA|nr:uncharacterized protein LOC21394009 [Morus notabilis]EXB93393.1 hypothetical protein L484_010721 [Morus notabilis]
MSVEAMNKFRKKLEISLEGINNNNMSELIIMKQAECECCGLKEECSEAYITQIETSYSGKWVCGLCSEAVKETMKRSPETAMKEAVSSHRDFCNKYNTTTRLNPKLSFTCDMREIAKRSCESRDSTKKNLASINSVR